MNGAPQTIKRLIAREPVRAAVARYYHTLLVRLGYAGVTGLEVIDNVEALIAKTSPRSDPPPEGAPAAA